MDSIEELIKLRADETMIKAQMSEFMPKGYRAWEETISFSHPPEKPDPDYVKRYDRWKLKMLRDDKIHIMARHGLRRDEWNALTLYENLLRTEHSPDFEAKKEYQRKIAQEFIDQEIKRLVKELS